MLVIESAGLTDVGRKRAGNEDAFYMDDPLGLYVVSDGMGGHLAGEVASRIVVDTLHGFMGSTGKKERTRISDATASIEANLLIEGIVRAHVKVSEKAALDGACRGMGATVSAVYFTGTGTFVAANVGDSPIYLIHNDAIEMVSVLHTVMAEYEAMAKPPKSLKDESFRHMLTRAVGINNRAEADICEIQCFKGDSIVICSDGLSDKVSPSEIGKIVSKQPPKESCRTLVDLANSRGGDDNITVVVLRIEKPSIVRKISDRLFGGFRKMFS